MKTRLLEYIRLPKNLRFLYRRFHHDDVFNILDVGCGPYSQNIVKLWFPSCVYYGLDKVRWNNSTSLMEGFYELDLTTLNFEDIPQDFFDVLFLSHVIEHLINGDEVIEGLAPKLKKGGIIYIEFPSLSSITLPSKKGTLNFFDDSTHCRLYSLVEIYNLLMKNDFEILKGGTRRDLINILLIPYNIIRSKRTKGFVAGSVFWDLLGFCTYALAIKK